MMRAKPPADAPEQTWPFAVELWSRDGKAPEVVVARASNAIIAKGAWDAACDLYPERKVLLRHKTRVIEESR